MAEKLKLLAGYSVPELCDGVGDYQTMDHHIRPWVNPQRIIGYALTVQVPPGDSALVTDALELVKEGQILVIAAGGSCESACWGDHRSFCAKFQQAAGVIIDGAFRDIEGCEEVGLPIFARGITPGAAGKGGQGAVNVPIQCGGVTVRPGDIVVADRNGVLVMPPELAEEAAIRAQKKIDAQQRTVEEMRRLGVVMPRIVVPSKSR